MRRWAFTALVLVLAQGPNARAVELIDFDDQPVGTYVSDEYADMGVVFPVEYFWVRDDKGMLIHASSPNMVGLSNGTGYITFVDPLDPMTPAVTNHFAFDNPGLIAIPLSFLTLIVVSLMTQNGNGSQETKEEEAKA